MPDINLLLKYLKIGLYKIIYFEDQNMLIESEIKPMNGGR